MDFKITGWGKPPLLVVIVFALMGAVGPTKMTFGVLTISAMVSNDLFLAQAFIFPSIHIILGAMAVWFATTLLLRKASARKPLLALAIVLLLLDIAAVSGLLWPRSGQSGSSSLTHIALNWITYVAVAWMLMTRSVMDYLQQGSSGTASPE